ncbi:MAG: hypothetical protein ACP6IP_08315 [Candidatus Njordarchaeia archaeon]
MFNGFLSKRLFNLPLPLIILVMASFLVFFVPGYVNLIFFNPVFVYIAVVFVRFLSGLGIFSIYVTLSMKILEKIAYRIKRKKREAELLRKRLIELSYVYFGALVAWYTLTIFVGSGVINHLNVLIGLLSAMIFVYIIPIWQEHPEIKGRKEFKESFLEKASSIVQFLKKGYYEKLVRDYGKAYAIEFARLKTRIDKIRYKAAKTLLAVVAIALIPIMPIAILSAYFYYELYIRKQQSFNTVSKAVLLVAIVTLIVYSIFVFMFSNYSINSVIWQIPYIVGAILALIYFKRNIK